jgi:small subunit ribosomal protein S13
MANETKEQKFKHIVRVCNVDVPGEKEIRQALTNIKGIGINMADSVCKIAGIDRTVKAGNLNDEQIEKITNIIKEPKKSGLPVWMLNRRKDLDTAEDIHVITGDLAYVLENDIKKEMKIKSLRGLRLQKKLPVRGQRTRSNFRKNKGKVASVKRKGGK